MVYDFLSLRKQVEEIKNWLIGEFGTIRTGRATTAFLDSIRVDAYGSKMPINQVANINIEDARTLRIAPWDKTLSGAIEKAIMAASLGVSVSTDDRGLRVNFPALTSETRAQILKVAKAKHEEARIRLKQAREKVRGDIQDKGKKGELTEDDVRRYSDEMQKIIDTGNKDFDVLYEEKEKEIIG